MLFLRVLLERGKHCAFSVPHWLGGKAWAVSQLAVWNARVTDKNFHSCNPSQTGCQLLFTLLALIVSSVKWFKSWGEATTGESCLEWTPFSTDSFPSQKELRNNFVILYKISVETVFITFSLYSFSNLEIWHSLFYLHKDYNWIFSSTAFCFLWIYALYLLLYYLLQDWFQIRKRILKFGYFEALHVLFWA